MAVVTINGQFGCGAREVGALVAQLLEADYVDRIILVEAAKRLGATVEALAQRERRPQTLGDRLARVLQNFLERSAVAGVGGEFSPMTMDTILSRPYRQGAQQPIARSQELDDARVAEVTTEVIRNVAKGGNVVLVGRASNIILKDTPGTFHAGLTTPYAKRVQIVMDREKVSDVALARKMAQDGEKARIEFYRKVFKSSPDSPSLYHMMLNMEDLDFTIASSIIAHAAICYGQEKVSAA
ncbi:MAG: cytidylate kinase-like family protein [Chloroflexi bacterium]|nr:cytidylate kinase-like family protein [Chloroflexota bacterium]